MAQRQDAMEGIMRLRVCFQPSPFVELFDLWLDLECFAKLVSRLELDNILCTL